MTRDQMLAAAKKNTGDIGYNPEILERAIDANVIPDGSVLAEAGATGGGDQLVRYESGEMVCYLSTIDGAQTITKRTPASCGDLRDYAVALYAGRLSRGSIHMGM